METPIQTRPIRIGRVALAAALLVLLPLAAAHHNPNHSGGNGGGGPGGTTTSTTTSTSPTSTSSSPTSTSSSSSTTATSSTTSTTSSTTSTTTSTGTNPPGPAPEHYYLHRGLLSPIEDQVFFDLDGRPPMDSNPPQGILPAVSEYNVWEGTTAGRVGAPAHLRFWAEVPASAFPGWSWAPCPVAPTSCPTDPVVWYQPAGWVQVEVWGNSGGYFAWAKPTEGIMTPAGTVAVLYEAQWASITYGPGSLYLWISMPRGVVNYDSVQFPSCLAVGGGACPQEPCLAQDSTPLGYSCHQPCWYPWDPNGGDDFTGYPFDPGCESPYDTDESDPETLPACSDGLDNDGDGLADYPADRSCASASQDWESRCSDGIDNDGDGLVDHPDDPDCASRADDIEAPPGPPSRICPLHPQPGPCL